MMLFDSHAHLSIDETLPGVLKKAHDTHVKAIVNVCCDEQSLQKALKLPASMEGVFLFCAAGMAPHDDVSENESFFHTIEESCRQKKLVAIGEVGLDYHYMKHSKDEQKILLRRYLQLAKKENLPLIVHCRDAFEDFFKIFDEEFSQKTGGPVGVLHCFTGTQEEAEEGLKRGFFISFSGIITFEKAENLRRVASKIDPHKILIETDSPYLAPIPYRGKKNEPAYLVEVARSVAEVKKISLEELAAFSFHNAEKLFSLSLH